MERLEVVNKIKKTLIKAGSEFDDDRIWAYEQALKAEKNESSIWVLESILENAKVAKENHSPLCDDSGIPHVIIDIGEGKQISSELLDDIQVGIREGLIALPGRPMGLLGNDLQRIAQSAGISDNPAFVEPAPILLRRINENVLRVHILMFGGGPAIRAKTEKVFHKHDVKNIIERIVEWSSEAVGLLGCSPCTLGVGIGRSHYEASSMMLQALVDRSYRTQSELELEITNRVNESGIGALGLGGDVSVLGTFLKVGSQRASGIRVVCVRPCCCMEPRRAVVDLE